MVENVVGDKGTQALHGAGRRLVQRRIGLRNQVLHVLADQVEQQVLLRADVVVERGGLNPHFSRQIPKAHRLEAPAVDEPQPNTADGGGSTLPVRPSSAPHKTPPATVPDGSRVDVAMARSNP